MESPDQQYKNLVNHILSNGIEKADRTGVGTLSVFGYMMRFDVSKTFPLLTTKRVYFKGVVEELLWMLRGGTNSHKLRDKNVRIWEANSSKEFLSSQNLPYQEGDLGPIYGHQWRHFNAEYNNSETDYSGQGVDQIKEVINLIKTNPTSRRIILCAWNPSQNKLMALPPCHCFCQFYVNPTTRELSCHLYQRSGDVGLGIPFNIASYALLLYLLAKICHLRPKDLIHTIGDAHIYNDHIASLKQQIQQTEYPSPTLEILNDKSTIDDYTFDDFKLCNYMCHKSINMTMAV